jgi:hypothetical protein
MRAYEFITEAPQPLDPDLVELIKLDWDSGKQAPDIAANLGISINQVNNILQRYYPERSGKKLHLGRALTAQDKDYIAMMFMDGAGLNEIAGKYDVGAGTVQSAIVDVLGLDAYKTEIARRQTSPGRRLPDKITPEISKDIVSWYKQGYGQTWIADKLDNLITGSTIFYHLRAKPNYQELRDEHDRNRQVRRKTATTTKIYRPGTIGNLRNKGPASKHMYRG